MKFWLAGICFFSLNLQVQASSGLTQDFKNLVARHKIGNLANQSYCYLKADGTLGGYQTQKSMPIASLTKLFTTYMAVELLDLNQVYKTKFHIRGDDLHIEGGNDPYFEEDKMLLLLQALNQKGYSSFRKITFDKNFEFSDVALGQYQVLSQAHIRDKIKTYFSASKNPTLIKNKWAVTVKDAEEEGIDFIKNPNIKMSVEQVQFVEKNPLTSFQHEALIHQSKPLHALLKAMNVKSKNLVSEYIFTEANKIEKFASFISKRGFNASEIKIYNGSGLPIISGSKRTDNMVSCANVVKMTQKLNASIAQKGFDPSQIIAVVGGKDLGSFRERFLNHEQVHDAVLAKTGTLAVSSTLAGTLMTSNGEIQFGIMNKPSSNLAARKLQDDFVVRMFHHLGEPITVPYEKISIFPWTDKDFFTE